ncbi:MAG TPA: hypothetical protein VK447_10930 [Myxococcaceae bacterium]|nr:hypothetical protein [Myxococcaceae bacterium]
MLRIGGMELRLGARMAREAYDRLMNPTLPEKLAVANFWVVRRGPEVSHLFGYSPTDLLELPSVLVLLLGRLHGRAVAEVPGFLERESGLAMPPDIVRQLLDFGVVTPA